MADAFAEEYSRYLEQVIAPLHKHVKQILDEWRSAAFWTKYKVDGIPVPEPLASIRRRDKRLESIVDKFQRLREEFPEGATPENLRKLRDVFGARVVVFVPDHIRLIDTAIRDSDHWDLADDLRPRCYLSQATAERIHLDLTKFDLKGQKHSGYASVHYFLRLRNAVGSENPIFELQVRTMLEDVWAEIEHQLGYKSNHETEFSVSRQFRVISHHLSALDDHFDFLYDRLNYLQARSKPSDQDPLNTENLPGVVDSFQLVLQQGDIGPLLSILEVRNIRTVGDLRAILRPEILEAMRHELATLRPNGHATAFDILPAAAELSEKSSKQDAADALRRSFTNAELVRAKRRELEELIRRPPEPQVGQ